MRRVLPPWQALETKNKELSMALASFSEFQTKAEQREEEIRKNTAKDDDRVQVCGLWSRQVWAWASSACG